ALRFVEIVAADPSVAAAAEIARAVDRLDPEQGWMLSAVWLHPDNEPGVLILAVHHLAADPISWRVIMSELEARWQAVAHQVPSDVDQTSIGLRQWANSLAAEARDVNSLPFWVAQLDGDDPDIGSRRIAPETDRDSEVAITAEAAPVGVSELLLNSGVPMERLLAAAV
ncbi:non-ribosomal peptide synthetase, partial [Staphylococcus capitis]|nr:non-ribosomal peptide synthetase [Staphylococcus capitis]